MSESKAADPDPAVTVKIAVNGSRLPKGHPFEFRRFAGELDVTPDQAAKLVEFYLRLKRGEALTANPVPWAADAALDIVLTVPQCWVAEAKPDTMAYLVPATGYAERAWHVALVDIKAGTVDGTRNPVTAVGVTMHLRRWGVADPGACDWRPCDDYGASAHNPFFPPR